jgi:hypothetical protein
MRIFFKNGYQQQMPYVCFLTLIITGPNEELQRFKNAVAEKTLQFGEIAEESESWLSELISDLPEQLVYKLEGNSKPDTLVMNVSREFPTLTFDCHCGFAVTDPSVTRILGKSGIAQRL